MILRIPDAYKLGFKYFFSLSEDEKNDLLDAIDKIEENNFNPFLGRVSLTYFEKVKILTTELAYNKLKRIF